MRVFKTHQSSNGRSTSMFRRHFNAGTIIAIVALVFAMSGGAYAASKYLITSTKQISPKVLKSLKGANGKNGVAGPAGPAGTAGAKGENGTAGANGKNGEPGASVTVASEGKGANCKEGGAKLTVGAGTPTYACNGEKGAKGEPGEPGETGFTETLPSGKTEKGVWGMSGLPYPIIKGLVEVDIAPISFTIPLKEAPEKVTVIGVGEEGKGGGCPVGSSITKPAAEKGNLCVFVEEASNVSSESIAITSPEKGVTAGGGEAGPTGALVLAGPETKGTPMITYGTWAVTAK